MKYRTDYHKKNKVIRISPGHYGLLRAVAERAGVTIDEALGLLLEQREPEPEKVTRVSPAQIRMVDVIMPTQVTARVMPSRVTGNGVAHIQPKIIKGVS